MILGELMVLIAGSNAALMGSLAQSEAAMKGFSSTAGEHHNIVASAAHTAGLAVLGMGAAAVVGGAIAAKSAGDFQEQMAIINTIAHQTPAELDKTGVAIRAMAASTGEPLGDMTKAFYDLLSAGVPVGQAMSVLKDSTTLAIGGLATTSQTVDLLTTAINSYHLNAVGASKATDQFALAVQDGKVTADQIAATFADVAPLAKQMGVGIDEISATYAVLTSRGVPAAESTTQMNRAMVELLKPNADLNALQEKTHLNFAKIAGEKGLVVALNEMREAAEKNHVPFQDLFGRLEGMKFALATTGPNFATYQDELGKMHHANGTAAAQAEERMGTFHRQVSILGETLNNLLITVGTPLLPFLTSFVEAIRRGVDAVGAWLGHFSNLGAALGSLVPAAGPVRAVIDGLGEGIGLAIAAIQALPGAVSDAATAVSGAVGAFADWAVHSGLVATALTAAQGAVAVIGSAVSSLAGMIGSAISAIVSFASNVNNQTAALNIALQAIDGVRSVLAFLGAAVGVVVGWIGNFISHLTGTTNASHSASTAMTTISGVLSTIGSVLGPIITTLGQFAATVIDNANKFGVFKAAGDLLYTLFGLLGDAIRVGLGLFGQLAGVVAGALSTAFNAITFVINGVTDAIRAAIGAIQTMIDLAGKAVGAVASIPGVKLGGDVVGNIGGALGSLIPHAEGVWNVGQDHAALLHAGEMVVPAHIAAAMRGEGGIGGGFAAQAGAGGGSSGQGGAIHLHHTTVLQIGDERIEELIERVLYRSGSALNSGWAGAE